MPNMEYVQQPDEPKRENKTPTGTPCGPNSGALRESIQVAAPLTSSSDGKQENVGPYINWKLRRALQHEREQLENQNHPDERHIIRIVQAEHNSMSPTTKAYICTGDIVTDVKEMPTSTTVTSLCGSDVFTRSGTGRDGLISPLDYVKNRIVEVMRTENQEDKSEEGNMNNEQGLHGNGLVAIGPSNAPSQAAVPSSSTSSQSLEHCSSTCGQNIENASVPAPTDTALSISYEKNTAGVQGERKNDGVDKCLEADSPASMVMVIDESAEEKDRLDWSNEQASSTTQNNPSYEPLTDEET
jgi:hypothetical protein